MFNALLFIVIGLPRAATASITEQRMFYRYVMPHIENSKLKVTADLLDRIDRLSPGDAIGYAALLFEAWSAPISMRERDQLKRSFDHVELVAAEEFPKLSMAAAANSWLEIKVLLPRTLKDSILYYYLVFHELEHCRQRCAVFENLDVEISEIVQPHQFWARFEQEKSAMASEWFFVHHLPAWARQQLTENVRRISVRDRSTRAAELAAATTDLELDDYLAAQWASGRYSWVSLHESCESPLTE